LIYGCGAALQATPTMTGKHMQVQSAVNEIRQRLSGIAENYNRLVLLVGPSGSGKTSALRALADTENVSVLNVGAEISQRLLDLTERQRVLQLPKIMEDAVVGLSSNLTLLDNTEVLFNPLLKQDPLRLLQGLSRGRTIVGSWLGQFSDGYLSYGTPDHPEFRRYQTVDLLLVCLGQGVLSQRGQR